jgi:hypothetical protein
MPQAKDIYGTVFRNGSAVLMARIVDANGVNVQQAGVAAIEYSIFELDPVRPDHLAVVAGHDAVVLDVSGVVHNSLQTGGLWTVDDVGYNFRHDIDVTVAEAFPKAGLDYQVRYELTPTIGQKTIVRFHLRAI